MRLRDILREMDKKYFDKKGLDFYELDVYLRELHKVNADIVQLERDKASAEAMATVWKEAYLDQVRENVKLQAKVFASVAGKYEDKIVGDESMVYNFISRLSEKEKENWRKLFKELDKNI
jgi:hypothetical protein